MHRDTPSTYGRYPRTLEEAFGPGARLDIDKPRRTLDIVGWAALVALVVFVIGTGMLA